MKQRAPRNRTIVLHPSDIPTLKPSLLRLSNACNNISNILDSTIFGDTTEVIPLLPNQFVDLAIIDPPYNMNKNFNGNAFNRKSLSEYEKWLNTWIVPLKRILKSTASIYVCSEWSSSAAVQSVLEDNFIVRNRITWEREKGRGAKSNWKNCSEDIWFCTVSEDYFFDVDAVKLKRRVIAPYTHTDGRPKDWNETENGRFRLTSPSNIWTDITVPFWSMPENTDHPTQKAEKLIAKLILASSSVGDIVFDPFLGSGTTSVVAKKLGRRYIGVEINEGYACLAEKRLELADEDKSIQGYDRTGFWERNTLLLQQQQKQASSKSRTVEYQSNLFDNGA